MIYYLNRNAQSTGEHEIHTMDCKYLPYAENRILLGYFNNCKDALKEAKKYYSNVDGCHFCCNSCHKK